MTKVYLEIDAKTKAAQKKLTRFGNTATKTMNGIQDSLTGVKVLAAGVAGFFAGRAVVSGIKSITDAAAIQEDAINALNTSLKLTNEYSKEASEDMQEYASQLQQTSIYGDELVLSQLALTKAYGATNDQAKDLVRASLELAAATGKSVEESTRQVSKTLGGYAGELGEVNPAIKALTTEQLKNGEAARILIEQYGGAAVSQINTYSGAMTQLSNVQGDLNEEMGFLITENPLVIEGIKKLTGFFTELIKTVKDNRGELTKLINDNIKGMIQLVPKTVGLIKNLVLGYNALKAVTYDTARATAEYALVLLRLPGAAEVVQNITGFFDNLLITTLNVIKALSYLNELSVDSISKRIKGLKTESDKFRESLDEMIEGARVSFDEAGQDAEDLISGFEGIKIAATEARDEVVSDFTDMETKFDSAQKALQGLADDISKIDGAKIAVETAGSAKEVESAFAPGISEAFGKAGKNLATQIDQAGMPKIATSIAGAMLAGAEGAKKLIATGIEAAGQAFGIPGLGPIAEQLMTLGPEGAKAMIEEFADALPDLVVTLIEALSESSGIIVEKMVDSLLIEGGLERIVVALVQAVPRVAYKFSESVVRSLNRGLVAVSERFGLNITSSMEEPDWVQNLRDWWKGVNTTPDWVEKLQLKTPPWIEDLERLVNRLTNWKLPGTEGKGKGPISSRVGGTAGAVISTVTGGYLNKGGIVYAQDGFVPRGTDTVPAMLTPGELVIPKSKTKELFNDIGNNEKLVGLLSAILDVLSSPMTTDSTIEVDGDVFADIMLKLSRQNARTAA